MWNSGGAGPQGGKKPLGALMRGCAQHGCSTGLTGTAASPNWASGRGFKVSPPCPAGPCPEAKAFPCCGKDSIRNFILFIYQKMG